MKQIEQAALDYAAHGIHVVPLHRLCRRAMYVRETRLLIPREASADPERSP